MALGRGDPEPAVEVPCHFDSKRSFLLLIRKPLTRAKHKSATIFYRSFRSRSSFLNNVHHQILPKPSQTFWQALCDRVMKMNKAYSMIVSMFQGERSKTRFMMKKR